MYIPHESKLNFDMKIFIIIAVVLFLVFVIFQVYTTMGTNKTESQKYEVIRTGENFEIRFYRGAVMAKITSTANSYETLGSSGFRQLAGYIFGGNESSQQIAMTTPVYMDINDSLSSMSFVMPSSYNENNLPKPNDSKVSIVRTNDEYIAAIQFGGFASDKEIEKQTNKLRSALDKNSIVYFGNFKFLGYNPPFQLFGRRNEVIVSVVIDKDPK
jgi:uncharacterized membrane protein YcgQ (UPF0703/DUF1980 family)